MLVIINIYLLGPTETGNAAHYVQWGVMEDLIDIYFCTGHLHSVDKIQDSEQALRVFMKLICATYCDNSDSKTLQPYHLL